MTTLNTQLKQLAGLVGTKDLSDWEDGFVRSLLEKTKQGDDTRALTEKQIDRLEELHGKHFS